MVRVGEREAGVSLLSPHVEESIPSAVHVNGVLVRRILCPDLMDFSVPLIWKTVGMKNWPNNPMAMGADFFEEEGHLMGHVNGLGQSLPIDEFYGIKVDRLNSGEMKFQSSPLLDMGVSMVPLAPSGPLVGACLSVVGHPSISDLNQAKASPL